MDQLARIYLTKLGATTTIEGYVTHDVYVYVLSIDTLAKRPYVTLPVELKKETGEDFPCHVRKDIPGEVLKRLMAVAENMRVKALIVGFNEDPLPEIFSVQKVAKGKKVNGDCSKCNEHTFCFGY